MSCKHLGNNHWLVTNSQWQSPFLKTGNFVSNWFKPVSLVRQCIKKLENSCSATGELVYTHTGRDSKSLWEKMPRQQRMQEQPTATTFWSCFTYTWWLIPAGWLFAGWRMSMISIWAQTGKVATLWEIIQLILLKLLFLYKIYWNMAMTPRKRDDTERKSVTLYTPAFIHKAEVAEFYV